MQRQRNHLIRLIGAAMILGCTSWVQADWATLDPDNSTVSFVSIKLNEISEVHFFESIAGSISDTREVVIEIEAASINTGIEIRDERMQELLFSVVDYPKITIRAAIDVDALPSGLSRINFPATVRLKGVDLPITVDAFVSLGDSTVTVSSAMPVIVSNTEAGLSAAVAKLSELAGGIAIGGSVPVSFFLSFDR